MRRYVKGTPAAVRYSRGVRRVLAGVAPVDEDLLGGVEGSESVIGSASITRESQAERYASTSSSAAGSTDGTRPHDRLPDAAIGEPDPDEPGQPLVLARPSLGGIVQRRPAGTCSRPAGRGDRCATAGRRSTDARIPSASRAPRRWVLAYASGVRISVRTARARRHRERVREQRPPERDEVERSPSGPFVWCRTSATASVMPHAPNDTPPAIDLPIVSRSGSRPHAAVNPPARPPACASRRSRAASRSRASAREDRRGSPVSAGSARGCS